MDLNEHTVKKFIFTIAQERCASSDFSDDTSFPRELAIELFFGVESKFGLTGKPISLDNSPFTVNTITKAIMASVDEGQLKEKKRERLHPDQLPKREKEMRSTHPGKVENLMIYLGVPPETLLTSYEGMKALMESKVRSVVENAFSSEEVPSFSEEKYRFFLEQEEVLFSFVRLLEEDSSEEMEQLVMKLKTHWHLCCVTAFVEAVTPSFHEKDPSPDSLGGPKQKEEEDE